ncbi:ORC1-type DNA replication protein [Candidatus Woesearchaeota archaeon]|nr:ORC1-type DNA replication protein [Candidatus Woesearchaeota archaeon]
MAEKSLTGFFESFINKKPIFKDKKVLQSNYTPDFVSHRDEQVSQIAKILGPALRKERPSNIFCYGKTGTGKTLTANYTTQQLINVANEKQIPLDVLYLNCKLKRVADTEYRLIAQLTRGFGKEVPATGLPTDEIYKEFFKTIEEQNKTIIIILDEIDQLIKKAGDEILYNLIRANSELKNSQISIIGISNDLIFADNLDPRIKSSLSEEEIVFPPYNALQIQNILRERSKTAFKQGILQQGVIEKCAAYAAREHGDARRALELLRVAAEIAERNSDEKVNISHIDEAEEKIERDRIMDIVITQPKQHQAALYSIIKTKENNKKIFTGEAYEFYKSLCNRIGLRPLTQRRISDIVAEFDMLGIINASVISKGRYGRTREISLAIPNHNLKKITEILEEGLELS